MTEPITLCELELPKEYKPGTIVEHFKRQHSLTQDEIKNKIFYFEIKRIFFKFVSIGKIEVSFWVLWRGNVSCKKDFIISGI